MLRREDCLKKVAVIAWTCLMHNLSGRQFESWVGVMAQFVDVGDWRHSRKSLPKWADTYMAIHNQIVRRLISAVDPGVPLIFFSLSLDKVSHKKFSWEIILLRKVHNGFAKEIVLGCCQRDYGKMEKSDDGTTKAIKVVGMDKVAGLVMDKLLKYGAVPTDVNSIDDHLDEKPILIMAGVCSFHSALSFIHSPIIHMD